MLLSHHQNAGQNHNIQVANVHFENVAQFRYLEMKEKIKIRLWRKLRLS
jgi:hypothetical protein